MTSTNEFTTIESAIEEATRRTINTHRVWQVISFTGATTKRFRVYPFGQDYKALKACKIGETPRGEGYYIRRAQMFWKV